LSAAWDSTVAVKDDGSVIRWKQNNLDESALPIGLSGVSAGHDHSLALNAAGTVIAWGAGVTNGGPFPLVSMISPLLLPGHFIIWRSGATAQSLRGAIIWDKQTFRPV
jgi:hypothetical protein